AVYATTSEVLGRETLTMAWHNSAATFEAAWEMAKFYLLAIAVATTALSAAVFALSRRSFRGLWPGRSRDLGAHVAARDQTRGTARFALPLSAGLVAVAVGLTWQVMTEPGVALTALFRAAPPLRAMNLTRAVVGINLPGRSTFVPGPPIVSD